MPPNVLAWVLSQVLDTCQSLYEAQTTSLTHVPIAATFLKALLSGESPIVDAIANNAKELQSGAQGADLSLKSKAWNDSKVDAHRNHPNTEEIIGEWFTCQWDENLSTNRTPVSDAQFYPPAVFADAKLVFDIAGGVFIAKDVSLSAGLEGVDG